MQRALFHVMIVGAVIFSCALFGPAVSAGLFFILVGLHEVVLCGLIYALAEPAFSDLPAARLAAGLTYIAGGILALFL